MGPLVPALLLWTGVLCAQGPALESAPAYSESERRLFVDLDPVFAKDFARRPDWRREVARRSAADEARFVERAAALGDLKDLLLTHEDAPALSMALEQRLSEWGLESLGLEKEPARLLDWSRRYAKAKPGVLEAALWEWDTLSAEQQVWLMQPPRNHGHASWNALSFLQRDAQLAAWAAPIAAELMRRTPATSSDLDAMKARCQEVVGALGADEGKRLRDRYIMAKAAVRGLGKVKELKDPALAGLLKKAREAPSLEQRLSAIEALFDKAGIEEREIRGEMPVAPGESLTAIDPAVLQGLLQASLARELSDTEIGRAVNAFHKERGLPKLTVGKADEAIAQYHHDTNSIVLSAKFIDKWLKAERLRPGELLKNPAALQRLTWVIAPVYVHEAIHGKQNDWARRRGVESWGGQHLEVEAMAGNALFVMQKQRAHEAYRRFLEERQNDSEICVEMVSLAAAFERDPRAFRGIVTTDIYRDTPSLDGLASLVLAQFRVLSEDVREEQRRREGLSKAQRAALDRNGAASVDLSDNKGWYANLEKARGSALEALLVDLARKRDAAVATYDATRTRAGQASMEMEAAREAVLAAPAGAARPRAEPPAPLPENQRR